MIDAAADTAAVDAAMNKIINGATTALEFDAIGSSVAENIRLGFRDGESPWGDPWAPLKKARRNSRDARISDKPLNDTRQHIYNKITHRVAGDSVEIGLFENESIGATHQYGSVKNNIPARPFLPIRPGGVVDLPESWEAEIEGIVSGPFIK